MLLAIWELVPAGIMRKAQCLAVGEPAKAMHEMPSSKVGKKIVGQATLFHRAVRDQHKNRFGKINNT